ncbi:methyltransferase domain-containing protein [Chitinophaga rhizophila]|uniref:Class I SAM-dependent methyltransferase n=1 Tax=Chitinophaga rhizophila TaxID=2866212 RepID=A0ABS7GAD9_9BACT|nr:methyltransferase domain-containing protein [Chitinophaga rhizophila]MBW8684626.1 class I SAM-dependent methyltransferase [Chitinophaga rhizophila]
MELLSEGSLIWSAVVANTRMNRERNASGINSYEQEFRFRPQDILLEYIQQQGHVSWLDVCCGQGKALIQAADYLASRHLQGQALLFGIDLIDSFLPVPGNITCLTFDIQSAVDWQPKQCYDLITCVHGIHYVGDKLKVLSHIFTALSGNGRFYCNLDLQNVHIQGQKADYLKQLFRKHHIDYNSRTKILSCQGPRMIDFGVTYLGADDQTGPNYTGQEAVTSHYVTSQTSMS